LEALLPIKVVKVSANDGVPLIYLPVDVRRALNIKKGDRLLLFLDLRQRQLIARKVAGANQLCLEEDTLERGLKASSAGG
jgi:bifunctional DNA-binding transcriptional regulator/antitoxin component of YhaV-PrlF toxin-antitoxin module